MSTLQCERYTGHTQGRMKSLAELMSLKGRVAIVTGGAGHIGRAISEALAELGAAIVVLDCQVDACQDVATCLRNTADVDAMPLAIDLRDESRLRDVVGLVMKQFGRIDVLVNCAAFVGSSDLSGWATSLAKQSSRTWRDALEVNLTAPFVLTQSCAEALAASGHGSVINVGSIYGVVGPDWRLYEGTTMGSPAAYAASKGGLTQLTRWLATSLAPKVRVNAISPGGVYRGQSPAFVDRYESRTPLCRMAVEEDFKGAIAFLASDMSAYVTGQNLLVDGGWTAW